MWEIPFLLSVYLNSTNCRDQKDKLSQEASGSSSPLIKVADLFLAVYNFI
jgi:hypothetical protein